MHHDDDMKTLATLCTQQHHKARRPNPPFVVFAGAALRGLDLGLTQGVFSAIVADVAPTRLRGTGFSLFNMATGVAMLIGGLGAGALWDVCGPARTVAAAVTAAAVAALLAIYRDPR